MRADYTITSSGTSSGTPLFRALASALERMAGVPNTLPPQDLNRNAELGRVGCCTVLSYHASAHVSVTTEPVGPVQDQLLKHFRRERVNGGVPHVSVSRLLYAVRNNPG